MTENESDTHLAFWESRFPGKGEALMEILRPFYDWEPELKPVLPDLEERIRNVVFWRDTLDVKVFTISDGGSLWASLWDSLWSSPRSSLRDSLRDSLWASLRDSLWDSLRDSLRFSLGFFLLDSLSASLFYSCGFILADKPEEAAKLQPLLDLWLAGNFPVGFDKDGNLLILVADPESE